jgi:protocatechuate 3,4-dioxygenase, alpha subunit
VTSRVTPAQTIGPFFHGALCRAGDERLVDPASAAALELAGRVSDGAGAPVADALVELWCTDGRASAFGRAPTDAAGEFRFTVRKPGAIPGPGESVQAPHLCVSLFARGLLHRLVTRIYFPDEAAANARDPLLQSIAAVRRSLLVARAAGPRALRFDIALQGEAETPFLDV